MQYKLLTACAVLWIGVNASAQTTPDQTTPAQTTPDQTTPADSNVTEIKSAIDSYVTAFNARNAEKLVALWCPEGVYTSRTSGEQLVGREAMAKEFAAILADENAPKLAVETESIEFISPNVALERGTAILTRGDGDVADSRYQVVYVKRDGHWLIDRVSEDDIVTEPSHYQQLQDLEWLIGEWSEAGEGFTIAFDCHWTEKQNFISRTYSVSNDENVESSGLQIIGWDAKLKQIRSWLFDSEGGVINGTWTKSDDHWVVQSVATLSDGATGSFTSIYRPLEDGNFAWQKTNRVLDGKLLPNIDEIVVQRK